MKLTPGTKLGSYEIIAPLGMGGMGAVFRARDTRLKRDVALKVLPDEFSRDADRVSRFAREAEVLASLNHPHIAVIYDVDNLEESPFLVLELVEGETLADRIARGSIPLDEAAEIARQIADALEAAHEKGIIHRDLKPANIKITPDGSVKVLDFGLAKVRDPAALQNLSNSPTMMSASVPGMILGTAAYMSPEQAKGRDTDRTADVWAFGCVLFEMLTGKAAFEGETIGEILAGVFKGEPDWSRLPAETPPNVRRLLRRCLQRERKLRLHDIADARLELDEIGQAPDAETLSNVTGPSRLPWIIVGVMTLGTVMFAIPAVIHWRETPPASPAEVRLQINTPPTDAPLQFALSPDARHIVFVASGDGLQRLWLRPLNMTDAQPMAGTEGASFPFWSADSRSIGFFASAKLYRIDISGGPPQALANAPVGRGGDWNADGVILFAPSGVNSPLFRVAAAGGEPTAVTRLDPPDQTSHRFPEFLSDGHHFLFHSQGSTEDSGIFLGSLDGGTPKRLTAADSAGRYLKEDLVLFVRQGALLARKLDIARGELTGDPITIANPVGYGSPNGFGGFSVSADGCIAFRSGTAGQRQLTWYERTGKVLGVAGEPDGNVLSDPEVSPDGRRVAIRRTIQNNIDLWLMDLIRGGFVRFTFDAAFDQTPLWSPDGTSIAFQSNRKGKHDLYLKASTGAGSEALLLETPNNKEPTDWSKDGRFLLYSENNPKTLQDLWTLEMKEKESKPRLVVGTPFTERYGQFSPDGRWIAYQTNESGRFEVVVQPFPEATGKWQVSTGGGTGPKWRVDGKEIYFIAPDGKLMAVPIVASGSAFDPGTPMALFPIRALSDNAGPFQKPQYAVARDGRFLINQPFEESTTSAITVILDWSGGNSITK